MEAKQLLKANNIKVTKQRENILSVLMKHHLPITINQIREDLKVEMDLSTIYRNLDTLYEHDLITRTVPLEPSQTVYELKRHIHKHHLICTQCGIIQVIQGCPLHSYEHEVEKNTGFIIDRHQLELYGLCPACQQGA